MWVNLFTGRFSGHLRVIALVLLSVVISMGCDNREAILLIEKPTEVRAITPASPSQDPDTNVQPGNVIATLKSSERVHAIGAYHGQGVDGFQVRLADGTEGLILAGDTFKVVSR